MTSSLYQLTLITGSRHTTNFNLSAVRTTRLITEIRHEVTDNWFNHSTWNHFVSVLFIYWSFVRGDCHNNQLINQKIRSATIFIIVFIFFYTKMLNMSCFQLHVLLFDSKMNHMKTSLWTHTVSQFSFISSRTFFTAVPKKYVVS